MLLFSLVSSKLNYAHGYPSYDIKFHPALRHQFWSSGNWLLTHSYQVHFDLLFMNQIEPFEIVLKMIFNYISS